MLPTKCLQDDIPTLRQNRHNEMKWGWAKEVWGNSKNYPNLTHIDWDKIYNVNYTQGENRAKYVQEERHVDQKVLKILLL